MIENFFTYIRGHKIVGSAICYGFILAIGYADFATGYRLGFSIFYLLPIAAIVWSYGLTAGFAISFIGTGVWILADSAARSFDFSMFILLWNASIRMCFFLIVVFALGQLRESLQREKQLSRTDFLTGIANIQAFMEKLNDELHRSRRNDRFLTLAYIDCDGFKAVNDSLGHETGNQLLRKVAQTIKSTIRAIDNVGRFGGDEFLILLPETQSDESRKLIERLQNRLLEVMRDNGWNVTFSIGVATFKGVDDSASNIISFTDQLMYNAKKQGKNRAVYKTYT